MFIGTKRQLLTTALFASLAVLAFCEIPSARAQNAQAIIHDMTLPPDAALHGTEKLNWGAGVASPQPIVVPARNWKKQWFRAITAWGQVYIPREGSPATNHSVSDPKPTDEAAPEEWEMGHSSIFYYSSRCRVSRRLCQ